MAYKKYTKKDFLEYAQEFDWFKKEEPKMKKFKLKDFQDFYNFTHLDKDAGTRINVNNLVGINCLSCADTLRPDYLSTRNKNYCQNCL